MIDASPARSVARSLMSYGAGAGGLMGAVWATKDVPLAIASGSA